MELPIKTITSQMSKHERTLTIINDIAITRNMALNEIITDEVASTISNCILNAMRDPCFAKSLEYDISEAALDFFKMPGCTSYCFKSSKTQMQFFEDVSVLLEFFKGIKFAKDEKSRIKYLRDFAVKLSATTTCTRNFLDHIYGYKSYNIIPISDLELLAFVDYYNAIVRLRVIKLLETVDNVTK